MKIERLAVGLEQVPGINPIVNLADRRNKVDHLAPLAILANGCCDLLMAPVLQRNRKRVDVMLDVELGLQVRGQIGH